ncbi:hydroxymethylglutaryl-CoA lyase [Daejeonella rubra]|uniref:Hydroxymethylglutaryl-CoA lyase n=1 Tax=Daejeonella rubra TaxID=990371 RepID=A0A1G9QH39_9SPHI|nr:hydroxymethylglutaryl-CoA lyase [Daejeonella rubra]SDM10372.1 hydroxymethylglutaryl-CoA lyase [Daejeonella rubra]
MTKLIECPRDAMQGMHEFIPTEIKAEYINLLLKVGFDTIDFGSFVSEKSIPQLKDTAEVLEMLEISPESTKLLAIVANKRGIEEAVKHPQISYLGFPFSVSETFQQRNTNSGIEQSLNTVEELLNLCSKSNKEAVIYLSMGFGNPYGDAWSNEIVEHWAGELAKRGAKILSLSDTTGVSSPEKINYLFPHLVSCFPEIEFGVHLHSNPASWFEKIEASWNSGCRRYDSALRGFGGCPMATDDLTGNIATESLISFLESKGEDPALDMEKWNEAMNYSGRIFR